LGDNESDNDFDDEECKVSKDDKKDGKGKEGSKGEKDDTKPKECVERTKINKSLESSGIKSDNPLD